MPFSEWLENADKALFNAIHFYWQMPTLDSLFLLLRNSAIWIPLYLFVFFWWYKKNKQTALAFILLTILCAGITDYISASVFKPFFARLRPCYDSSIQVYLRNIISCGGNYGFPSSHAANHFGIACFWYNCFFMINRKKQWWVWIWAFAICYAQIYVGKHYPTDIIAGALLGISIGYIITLLFKYINNANAIKVLNLKKKTKQSAQLRTI